MEAAASPFPRDDTTPPVTKMNFVVTSGPPFPFGRACRVCRSGPIPPPPGAAFPHRLLGCAGGSDSRLGQRRPRSDAARPPPEPRVDEETLVAPSLHDTVQSKPTQ